MIDGSPDLSGDILEDRYRLVSRLGTEWFGDIYEAEQLRLGRTVSIKILATDANTPELLGRFLREAQALARLQHPGIVFVIDFGVHRGRPFLVRDVVNGESLEKRLERVGRYLPEDVGPVLIAIAEALEHAHGAGVIHRHLTPSSVLFDENNRVRIGNFGLVRLLEAAGDDQLTAPGTIVGWSPYAAPEQAKGSAIDARADLYALGVIGHQMLAGKLPGYENSIGEVVALPKEASALAAAIDRLRSRSADGRFPSAAWTLNVLRAATEELALPDASSDINTAFSNAGKPPPLPATAVPSILPPPLPHESLPSLNERLPSFSSLLPPAEESLPSLSPLPPLLPPSSPPTPSRPPSHESLPSLSHLPPEPSISFSPDRPLPRADLSVDIPGFFDASSPGPPPSEHHKAPSHFGKQLRHATPTFFVLLLLAGGAFAFWYFVIGLPNPVAEARALVRAGKVSGVIQQLEDLVSKTPDDAALHSALGYAYVHGNSPAKAFDHFRRALEKNPSSLEKADVAALVGLLAVRGPNSLVAQKLLQRTADPELTKTILAASFADKDADVYVRCRVADMLQTLGEKIDLQQSCAGAMEGKSAEQRAVITERLSKTSSPPTSATQP